MSLRPLDKILQDYPGITEEERCSAEKLHVALGGGVKRDTLDNHEKAITNETLDGIASGFDRFMNDSQNQSLMLR